MHPARAPRNELLPRLLVAGHFNSSELTPLDEIYAPDLERLPAKIQHHMRAEFWKRLGDATDEKKSAAAGWLAASVAELMDAQLHLAFDPEAIEQKARNCARVCFYIKHPAAIEEFCAVQGIDPPKKTTRSTGRGRMLRARDPRFWRRELAKFLGRKAENCLRRTGTIRRGNQLYASDLAVSARRWKQSIIDRWVKERVVVSNGGTQCGLWEVRAASQANPAIRRTDLMTRAGGFERIAEAAGHVADFYTLTLPSAYHCTNADGTPNQHYQGFSVRDGQGWLNKMWARARAKIKRLKILIYGFRIAEPHHDGTPHWHMVLFTLAHHRETVRRVLRGFWLSEHEFERGAEQHRVNIVGIDSSKGSAAGYLAKYIAKNIDGFEVGEDYESGSDGNRGADSTGTCERVTTWATRFGIRQFQQIGGPAVTVWRELRRIRTACDVASIEAARVHADAGDWQAFVAAIGGIEAGRAGTVGLWSEITGEINQYDELRGPQITGVRAGSDRVSTREVVWRIVKKSSLPLGPVTITVREDSGVGSPSGWSNPHETSMYGPN